MIPNGNSGNSRGSSVKGNRGGFPYLKSENLTVDKTPAKIIAARYEAEGTFGPHIVVKVNVNGRTYLHDVTQKNPNFDELVNKFGSDEKKWAGKEYFVHNEQDDFNGNWYVRVTFTDK